MQGGMKQPTVKKLITLYTGNDIVTAAILVLDSEGEKITDKAIIKKIRQLNVIHAKVLPQVEIYVRRIK
jgi:hypothetical protein